jgi:RNA polymerase sigma-70 factor, ECF subfamily
MTTAAQSSLAETFQAHRSALTGLAYRMLGSRAEAEDVVQDAYLRWHAADRAVVKEPRHYLGTVVTRLCLDRMKSARVRRELYVGQWLPEPVVDESFDDAKASDTASDMAHDISVALMLVLERLSPLERASFLLHDVFGLDFAEVSQTLGRAEPTCRQLAARARRHIEAGRPRFAVSHEEGHRLAAAFQKATSSGNLQSFTQILADDVVLYSDGGGKRAAALKPIYGADKVTRFIEGISRKNSALLAVRARPAIINGCAGFVLREEDGSIDTMSIDVRDGRITAIYLVRNPEKLKHVQY